MIVGILFCASNSKAKTQKFYEVCQTELNPAISANDKDLKKYFIKQLEISYEMMIQIFNHHKPEEAKKDWIGKNCSEIYQTLFEEYLDALFAENSKLE